MYLITSHNRHDTIIARIKTDDMDDAHFIHQLLMDNAMPKACAWSLELLTNAMIATTNVLGRGGVQSIILRSCVENLNEAS